MDGRYDSSQQTYTDGGYYSQQSYDGVYQSKQQTFTEVKCPGKEITGMVMGINSLVWGCLGAIFGAIMFMYGGIIYAVIWGGFGIGCGIVALSLHKQVHEQATTITNKIENGRKMGIAGIIVSIVGIVISILLLVIAAVLLGAALFASGSASQYGY